MLESILNDMEQLFPKRPFLTIEDVAQALGCEGDIVYRWTKRPDPKKRPPRILVGKDIRFPKREFIKWLVEEQSGVSS